jgi:hypothetical protein
MRSLYRRSLLLPTALAVGLVTLSPASADGTTGSISGRITRSDGAPAAWAQVTLRFPSGAGYYEGLAEPDGTFRFDDVRPGTYTMQVVYDGVTQYAHQRLTSGQGDAFTVEGGRNTTVDERMFEPGAIDVKVVDAESGDPVETACATVAFHGAEHCAAEDGVFRFTGLGAGSDHAVDVRSQDGLHMPGHTDHIAVELGRTTEVTVRVDPAAVITTRVLDRVSHSPVPWACVFALPEYFRGIQSGDCAEAMTAQESDVDGTVRIGEIPAGVRRLFVDPQDGDHGVQWVGKKGGTGGQDDALKIDAVAGHVTAVPPILLDPYGSLSGTFTDPSGAPLPAGTSFCATVMPQPEQGLPPGASCGGSDGTFTITGLGPYRWPVGFSDPWTWAYGVQWPGGADRRSAPTHQVRAGTVSEAGTARLTVGRTLSGSVRGPGGGAWPGSVQVSAFDARTGDLVGMSPWSGGYAIPHLIGPSIRLQTHAEGYGSFWYENATDFPGGTDVQVGTGQDTALDLVVPVPTG